MKRWIIIGASITGVVMLAVIGYLVVPLIASQQNDNAIRFEKFGLAVLPGAQYSTSVGELGVTQLPSTFAEDELTPEEKVVESLVRDRNALIEENQALRQKNSKLEMRMAELENYKATNERYPKPRTTPA